MPVTLVAGILASKGVEWDEFRIVKGQVHLLWRGAVYVFRYIDRYSSEAREYYHAVAKYIRSHQMEVKYGNASALGVTIYVDDHLEGQKSSDSIQRGQGLHDSAGSPFPGKPPV